MNVEWIVLIHVLGALTTGFYLLLPFVIRADQGALSTVIKLNRVGQYAFIAQFLTGGYLLSGLDKKFSFGWMGAVLVLVFAVGALSGIMAGPLRRGEVAKAKTFATIIAIIMLVIVFLMYVPDLFPSIAYR
jgi:hypothetical protein